MSKLYIFGIGGTGSRVLRSFTMMLAAGVNLKVNDVVPIIIDPDQANADLSRTVQLLNDYRGIRENLTFTSDNRFFYTSIQRTLPNFTMPINNTNDKKFKNFIGYQGMDTANQAMVQMLFSNKNLESTMTVGFKGNPNIGSVVLNQLSTSQDLIAFANSFQQGDKIFIISSIFGGTGASGFPLLLKTLRTDRTIPNFAMINAAVIGAVTVLPYFKLKQDETSEIDSSTFISKTKSALAYYENNVVKNSQINALYYLADDIANAYENHEGGNQQRNDAHLIEFLAATAIIDFCNNVQADGSTTNKEIGLNNGNGAVTFSDFDNSLNNMLRIPLTQFILMANCLVEKGNEVAELDLQHNFSNNFFRSEFINKLKNFLQDYRNWLGEMKSNQRSLDLFNLECGNKPFNVVTGATVYGKSKLSFLSKQDYSLFYDTLNSLKNTSGTDENKLLEIFYKATKQLIEKKFKF